MTRCAGVGIFLFSFSSLLFLVGFLHSADACERLQKEEVVVRRRERERKRERKRERESKRKIDR
jgi:hypothetical protein